MVEFWKLILIAMAYMPGDAVTMTTIVVDFQTEAACRDAEDALRLEVDDEELKQLFGGCFYDPLPPP